MPPDMLRQLGGMDQADHLVLTIGRILPSVTTRTFGIFMVLAPRSVSQPKLLLKPGRWTVGSAPTCSYRIVGDGVQPRHALVLCGGQTAVLKTWDPRTWLNGQPVVGEVHLHPGDRITLGTVELSFEAEDDSATMYPAPPQVSQIEPATTPNAQVSTSSPASVPPHDGSNTQPEGWDLERLREQIQELRDELAQRVLRRGGAATNQSVPTHTPDSEAEQTSARVTELEQAVTEAQQVAHRAQQELAAAIAEHARREAELRQASEDLRPALEASQQNIVELTRELDQLRSETAQRERIQNEQEAAWNAEREQWQQELDALKNAGQKMESDWEQRQLATVDDATRWQAECEQLRTAWQLQQAAWENERVQLQNDVQRYEERAQQAQTAVTQREQELAERSQQLIALQQQLQTGQLERDQAAAALAEERQHVEQHAADVLEKFEDLSRRVAEFEQQQANFAREHQTLEHSWNWLQSDRRKLVEEKENWQQQRAVWQAEHEQWTEAGELLQREREEFAKARESWQEAHVTTQQLTTEIEQLLAQRQQLQTELATQREQIETERRFAVSELEAARSELHAQQQAVRDEQERLEALRLELDAHSAKLSLEQQPSVSDHPAIPDETADHGAAPSWTSTRTLDIEGDWTPRSTTELSDTSPSLMATLAAPWSVGVDLTAPRETCTSRFGAEPDSRSEQVPSREDGPASEMPSTVEQPDDQWDAVTTSQSADDRHLIQPGTPESTQHDSLTDSGTTAQSVSEPEATLEPTLSASDDAATTTAESPGQVFSILESMAFHEDEDVDESVSRYMQHLLSRSTEPKDGKRDRYIPISAVKRSVPGTAPTADSPSETPKTDNLASRVDPLAETEEIQEDVSEPIDEAPLRRQPVQQQDRAAIRAATEQMRQVANQQTVKVVEAANRKLIRQSIKSKVALAALSFVLSAGLLYWGYQERPEFLILGFCTSGLGIVTWLDLLFAIRQGRVRTSQLTGRKKSAGSKKT